MMAGRKLLLLLLPVALVLGGAWAVEARAQTDDCPVESPDCCDPRQSADDDREEAVAADDCPPDGTDAPGGRSHRRGGDGSGDTLVDDDTGSAGEGFSSGSRLRRGTGSRAPGGAGGVPAGAVGSGVPGGGTPNGSPGGAAPTGSPPAPGPAAVSSPGVRPPVAAPSVAGASNVAAARAGAGQGPGGGAVAGGGIARTGPDIGLPVGLAMTLLVVGTSLRRAARPERRRVPRRRPPTARRGRPTRPTTQAPPSWSYVDLSSAARAIEKF